MLGSISLRGAWALNVGQYMLGGAWTLKAMLQWTEAPCPSPAPLWS